ncbi:MAG: DUF72 domain-containing protein [Actinobacteria bacterium]|nr:MAG: DUF72 domain-containing protein [Actinomycetota bacterium]
MAAPRELPSRRRPAGERARGIAPRPPLLRVPPRELVHARGLRAAARARRGTRDRRQPETTVPGARDDRLLDEDWAKRIARWRRRVEVFAYFNNDWEGFAVRNGLWLRRRLGV